MCGTFSSFRVRPTSNPPADRRYRRVRLRYRIAEDREDMLHAGADGQHGVYRTACRRPDDAQCIVEQHLLGADDDQQRRQMAKIFKAR